MAGCDYKYCENCDKKAYYDSDVDYCGSNVFVLCKECSKKFYMKAIVEPKEEQE